MLGTARAKVVVASTAKAASPSLGFALRQHAALHEPHGHGGKDDQLGDPLTLDDADFAVSAVVEDDLDFSCNVYVVSTSYFCGGM